jgi:hypothetical protein
MSSYMCKVCNWIVCVQISIVKNTHSGYRKMYRHFLENYVAFINLQVSVSHNIISSIVKLTKMTAKFVQNRVTLNVVSSVMILIGMYLFRNH